MDIIAHRGASGYEPENTLASFQEAIALGPDVIEFDVFVIKSGEVVVFHDETVDRTTNGKGRIANYTFDELRKLDAGHGQKIPLLTEVLDLVDHRIRVNIELKGGRVAKPVSDIINKYIAHKGWSRSQFMVSSFNQSELARFSLLQPDIKLGTLFRDNQPYRKVFSKKRNAYSASMAAASINRDNVHEIHAYGLKIYAYTVNSRHEMERLKSLKVDGIFTNYPDRAVTYTRT